MQTKSLALIALVVVMLSIATGVITWQLIDHDNDESTAAVQAPPDVAVPHTGTQFRYKLSSVNPPAGYGVDNYVFADVVTGNNAGAGRLRYDELYPQDDSSTDQVIATTIFRFDESPPAQYDISTYPGDGMECTKTALTEEDATKIAANAETSIKYSHCNDQECFWDVWDGQQAIGYEAQGLANQKWKTDKTTGTLKSMEVKVCTGSDCKVAHDDWLHCACAANPHQANCCNDDSWKQGICTSPKTIPALSATCASCDAFPPASGAEFCGTASHWFEVTQYEGAATYSADTPLFQTPVDENGASICVEYKAECDYNSASYDANAVCADPPQSLGHPVIAATVDNNTPGTGFKQVIPTPISVGAVPPTQGLNLVQNAIKEKQMFLQAMDKDGQLAKGRMKEQNLCWLLWFSSALRNACNAYMATSGKYGRWCGQGGDVDPPGGGCPTSAGSVCDDGGFDNCCKGHDNGAGSTKKHHKYMGPLTIVECGADKLFQSCRRNNGNNNNRDRCAKAGNTDMGSHNPGNTYARCSASLGAANTLFDVLPCMTWVRKCSFWRWGCSWRWVDNWKWGRY